MSLRPARQVLTATTRASFRQSPPSTFARLRLGGRRLNSTSHGPEVESSDKPWIIASAVIFGPAFLYLLSPSARKNTHFTHDDAHDFPGHKTAHREENKPAEATPVVVLKDDEGKEADVTESVQKAEVEDAPSAGGAAAEVTASEPQAAEAANVESQKAEKADAPQESSKSGPTDAEPAANPVTEKSESKGEASS